MTRCLTILAVAAILTAGSLLQAQPTAAVADATTRPTVAPILSPSLSPVERANSDAVSRLHAQILSERVDGVTIAQLVDRVGGDPILMDGLARAEQVGGPRYVTDELVQVQLQISGSRVATLLRQAVEARPAQSPISLERLDTLLKTWDRRAFTCTGDSRGTVSMVMAAEDGTRQANAAVSQPAVSLPDRMPGWGRDVIVASAVAPSAGSPLLTARAAERAARDDLRKRVDRLQLDDRHTIADLAGSDPRQRDLLDAAIDDAGLAGVDYRANGSVGVRVALDAQRLWQTLQLTR